MTDAGGKPIADVKVEVVNSGVADTARAFSTPAANTVDKAKLYAARDAKLSNRWQGASATKQ